MKNIERDEREIRDFSKKDLSRNEAAYGKSNLYPDSVSVRNLLAYDKKVKEDEIIFTNGSDNAIKMIFDRFLKKRDWVIRPDPTFGMLDVFEQIREVRVDKVDYELDKTISLQNRLKKKHKLLYLANPDNPTGHYFNGDELIKILDRADYLNIIVILDIVYLSYASELNKKEYYETSLLELYPNLLIVNSFSKSHGLAGDRIGYIISQKDNIDDLKEISQLHPLNSTAIKNLEKLLGRSELCIEEKNVYNAFKWKRVFAKEFPNLFQETKTNFINLMIYDFYKRMECVARLEDAGIIVKTYEDPICMNSTLRISIGPETVMKKVLKIIKGVLK